MTLDEAIERAFEEPTLVKGLTFMALWETGRIVEQVGRNLITGQRGPNGELYEARFEMAFTTFLQRWNTRYNR